MAVRLLYQLRVLVVVSPPVCRSSSERLSLSPTLPSSAHSFTCSQPAAVRYFPCEHFEKSWGLSTHNVATIFIRSLPLAITVYLTAPLSIRYSFGQLSPRRRETVVGCL